MELNGHTTDVDTLRELFARRATLGDKPLLVVDGESLTFREADRRGNMLGNALLAANIRPGDVVACLLYNSTDHFVVWAACAKIGAIWAPLTISLGADDLRTALTACDPVAVVVDEELVATFTAAGGRPPALRVLRTTATQPGPLLPDWRTLADLEARSPSTEPDVVVTPGDPVALIFTSGTTGLPKGVLLSSTYCLAGCLRYREMFEPSAQDVHIGVGQMFHAIGSVVDIVCPLYSGMTTVLTRWFSARRFWPTVRAHSGTISVLVGPVLVALLARDSDADDRDTPLRVVGSVTGGLDRHRVLGFGRRFGVRLLEMYGQTETGAPCVVGQRPGDDPVAAQGMGHGWTEIAVAAADGSPAPPGVEGEILLRPTEPGTFMLGYHRSPDLVVERCRDLWFHTGDLGRLDEAGHLHFVGRQAHRIRRRGENVSAHEVERAILDDPDVAECAVVGVPDCDGDEEVKAFVRPRPGAAPDPAALVERLGRRLAYFKVPRFVELVDELPRSASKGEILRHELAARPHTRAWDRERRGVAVPNLAFHPTIDGNQHIR
jgi:crotonobetaine/carnitine-CoA ligase